MKSKEAPLLSRRSSDCTTFFAISSGPHVMPSKARCRIESKCSNRLIFGAPVRFNIQMGIPERPKQIALNQPLKHALSPIIEHPVTGTPNCAVIVIGCPGESTNRCRLASPFVSKLRKTEVIVEWRVLSQPVAFSKKWSNVRDLQDFHAKCSSSVKWLSYEPAHYPLEPRAFETS